MRCWSSCKHPGLQAMTQRIIQEIKTDRLGLTVKMRVEDQSLAQAELAAFTREAHDKICPYSHATRGNVDVAFEVIGG